MHLFNVLTVIFIIAKILGYIDWSWWLVLAPSLFSMFITIAFIFIAVLIQVKK